MVDESMSVAPSVDQGNISVETETPETPAEPSTTTETPAETVETATPTESELFELPDGRKVDAQTLTKEWKDNFLPDYTKKSQALAEQERAKTINKPADPLADPAYVPQSYEELAAQIEARTLAKLDAKENERVEHQKAIETAVEQQLADIKKVDPNVNENAVFLHANKYGFRDLKLAHQNMRDMSESVKKAQQTTAAAVAKRSDAVSITPGATGARPQASQFATAREFLEAVKARG